MPKPGKTCPNLLKHVFRDQSSSNILQGHDEGYFQGFFLNRIQTQNELQTKCQAKQFPLKHMEEAA